MAGDVKQFRVDEFPGPELVTFVYAMWDSEHSCVRVTASLGSSPARYRVIDMDMVNPLSERKMAHVLCQFVGDTLRDRIPLPDSLVRRLDRIVDANKGRRVWRRIAKWALDAATVAKVLDS